MTVQQFTDEDLAGIRLDDLIRYLENDGWSRIGRYGNGAWIYEYKPGWEALVPIREDLVDYASGVRDVLRGIARIKGCDPTVAYHDVRFRRHDTFRIQAVDSRNDDGTISPDAASGLYTGSPQLWEWSVKRALFDADEARRYWQQARFGQTERGSYVVTMISPPLFSGCEITLDVDAIEQTPTRKVTNWLRATVKLTRCTLDHLHNGDDTTIDRARERGLESVACEALFKMVEPFESTSFQIYESQLVPKVKAEPSIIRFQCKMCSIYILLGGLVLQEPNIAA